jgi:hypothetical protein
VHRKYSTCLCFVSILFLIGVVYGAPRYSIGGYLAALTELPVSVGVKRLMLYGVPGQITCRMYRVEFARHSSPHEVYRIDTDSFCRRIHYRLRRAYPDSIPVGICSELLASLSSNGESHRRHVLLPGNWLSCVGDFCQCRLVPRYGSSVPYSFPFDPVDIEIVIRWLIACHRSYFSDFVESTLL